MTHGLRTLVPPESPGSPTSTQEATMARGRIFGTRFAIIPEWVIDAPISDRAKVLYALLGRYAGQEGHAYPGRRVLADRLACSTDSIDRALRELTDVGAVTIEHHRNPSGDFAANDYHLHADPAPIAHDTPPENSGSTPPPAPDEAVEDTLEDPLDDALEAEPEDIEEPHPCGGVAAALRLPSRTHAATWPHARGHLAAPVRNAIRKNENQGTENQGTRTSDPPPSSHDPPQRSGPPATGEEDEEEIPDHSQILAACWAHLAQLDLERTLDRGTRVAMPSHWLAEAARRRAHEHAERARALLADYPDLTPEELAGVLEGGQLPPRHRSTPAFRIPERLPPDVHTPLVEKARAAMTRGSN